MLNFTSQSQGEPKYTKDSGRTLSFLVEHYGGGAEQWLENYVAVLPFFIDATVTRACILHRPIHLNLKHKLYMVQLVFESICILPSKLYAKDASARP